MHTAVILLFERNIYLVDETGLADVGVTTQQQGPGVRVNRRQTGQMLTNCRRETTRDYFLTLKQTDLSVKTGSQKPQRNEPDNTYKD